jgi:hypothetical protein
VHRALDCVKFPGPYLEVSVALEFLENRYAVLGDSECDVNYTCGTLCGRPPGVERWQPSTSSLQCSMSIGSGDQHLHLKLGLTGGGAQILP